MFAAKPVTPCGWDCGPLDIGGYYHCQRCHREPLVARLAREHKMPVRVEQRSYSVFGQVQS